MHLAFVDWLPMLVRHPVTLVVVVVAMLLVLVAAPMFLVSSLDLVHLIVLAVVSTFTSNALSITALAGILWHVVILRWHVCAALTSSSTSVAAPLIIVAVPIAISLLVVRITHHLRRRLFHVVLLRRMLVHSAISLTIEGIVVFVHAIVPHVATLVTWVVLVLDGATWARGSLVKSILVIARVVVLILATTA